MSLYNDASLAMIPSAVKDGKLYSIRPTDGSGDFTFSRGSNLAATRVDVNGLIEKGRENLLLQSNQFDTTWATGNTSVTSGQSGYDGSNDAWLLSKSAAYAFINQNLSSGNLNTFSVYAKAGSLNWIAIQISGSPSPFTYFDLSGSGAVGTEVDIIDSVIESVGGGWFRISIAANNTGLNGVYIYPADADATLTGTSGNIYIQDAQLEVGLVATDYIETTTTTAVSGITEDLPRLDYSGGASCPSLLLEPQRLNLLPQSEYFGASDWLKSNATIIDNNSTSPEGVQNASKLIEDSSNSTHRISDTIIVSGTGVAYTQSIFAKSGGNGRYLRIFRGSGTYNYAVFDLDNGVVFSQGGSNLISTKIEEYPNGWYKCSSTFTTQFTNIATYYGMQNGNLDSYQGDGTSGIYIWGAQLEEGSYPTSYIPSYGSAVTRSSDSCYKTGVADLINDGDGTLYIEVTPTNFEGDQRFGISDNIGANRIVLRLFNPSNFQLSCVINSTTEVSMANSGYSVGNTYKIAGAWANNDAVLYVNGVQIATDTDCNIIPSNSLTRISFDNGIGTAKFENPVSQVLYFPTRLSNAELQALTTL